MAVKQLEAKGGFSKRQIFDAIKAAKDEDWIFEWPTVDGAIAWALKPEARYYVEGLLEQ